MDLRDSGQQCGVNRVWRLTRWTVLLMWLLTKLHQKNDVICAMRLLVFLSYLMKRYKQSLLSAGKRIHPIMPGISWYISLKVLTAIVFFKRHHKKNLYS